MVVKNYFIIHGSFGNSKEHYLPWLKKELEGKGEVICIDFPIGKDLQNYDAWEQTLLKYKDKINKDSVFIGRSIAPIFIIKFCLKNNFNIKKLISVSGFNCFINNPEYDYVNKSFLLNSIDEFKNHCNEIVCFYSDNDPFVPFFQLDIFARCLDSKKVILHGAGHFNSDSGYKEKFEDLLYYID